MIYLPSEDMAKRRWTRDPVTLVVAALASYRMTRLITTDHLPVAEKARTWLEDRTPGNYTMVWTCPHCMGFWCAVAVTVTGEIAERRGQRNAFVLAALPWAISTVTGMIAEREVN